MNCPKCRHKMPFQERICRRCLWCGDLDVFVDIDPPRARRGRVLRKRMRAVMLDAVTPKSIVMLEQRRFSPAIILTASMIPGLGQVLLGKLREGLLFFVVVTGLIVSAFVSDWSTETSMLVIGLAFGIHVAAAFRVTTVSQKMDFFVRLGIHVGIFAVLAALIYGPINREMMHAKPQFTYDRGVPMAVIMAYLGVAVQVAIASLVLSLLVSRLLDRNEKRKA